MMPLSASCCLAAEDAAANAMATQSSDADFHVHTNRFNMGTKSEEIRIVQNLKGLHVLHTITKHYKIIDND